MKSSTPEGIDLTYELSTREKICSNMMLRDPYEKQMVEVKTSNAENAGEGVFALQDIPSNGSKLFACVQGLFLQMLF